MRRRSRTRRVLKWVGTVACIVLIDLYVASVWCSFTYCSELLGCGVDIAQGRVGFLRKEPYYNWLVHGYESGPHFQLEEYPGLELVPYYIDRDHPPMLAIPLWLPILAIATPTFMAWFAERRFTRGYCRDCGYNLTGNVSGRCPECGTALKREDESP